MALGKELVRSKRKIVEMKSDLLRVEKKSASMTSLVSVIERAWNQVRFLKQHIPYISISLPLPYMLLILRYTLGIYVVGGRCWDYSQCSYSSFSRI